MKLNELTEDGYYWAVPSDGSPAEIVDCSIIGGNPYFSENDITATETANYFGPLQPPSLDSEPVTSQGDVLRVIDATNADQLVCRRVECFFSPNTDRTPSANARIIFHTEWWAYSGEVFRGANLGPQIEVNLADVLPLQFDVGMGVPVSTTALVQGIILAFEHRARLLLEATP